MCRVMSLWHARALHRLLSVLAGITLALTFAVADDRQPVNDLHARVTDLTNTLDITQTQTLTSELEALEKRKGSQIGVLIVPTTQPEDIAHYSIRVFDAWKLGRKDIDDGVLLVVAKSDHSVRIEVARGLEGAIPDAAAARIIREFITPKFRASDFYGGIHDAVGILTQLIDGEQLPAPTVGSDSGFVVGIFLFFFGSFWAFAARQLFGDASLKFRAPAMMIVCGGALWYLTQLEGMSSFYSLVAASIGSFLALLLALIPRRRTRSSSSGGGSSSDSGSSSSSGGSSSSSSSDSGFSGGGGESAGGGASGSW